ncbi:aldehyde reductase [Haloferax mucosum ATCC BAA-1512]|uniref:Aldehyde reductase n=1 Tax=Haloferax mucosum ATCC BAA-1512 TaxID=662479 RepID=M0I886_9EURY|nr:aldo/keto reductase [Haloferax mucosum]ELZ91674.1 aldehyde reductase [Haloferax mucosum ATCC BAA-1512]
MPMLGLGTWENTDPDECTNAVKTALEMGYRHIDTAQIYGNEAEVGEGIAAADVDRDDIFLATKVWIDELSHDDVIESTRESLDKLGVEYVDLLYVHWPAGEYDAEATLSAFDELVEDGLTKRVGVSNFEPEQLREAVELSESGIFANQVELHPLLQQDELRDVCADEGVEIVAYSPLARGTVFDVDVLSDIAEKHDVSEAQVSLAWLRENGVTAIPKATSEGHIRDNWESLELTLDDEDIAAIDAIETTDRRVDPGFAPW